MEEVKLWCKVCNIPKNKQGIMLWLCLPWDHHSNVKDLIMVQVGMEVIKTEDGVYWFVDAWNKAFQTTDEDKIRDMDDSDDSYKKMEHRYGEKVSDFVNWFVKQHNDVLPLRVEGEMSNNDRLTNQNATFVNTNIDQCRGIKKASKSTKSEVFVKFNVFKENEEFIWSRWDGRYVHMSDRGVRGVIS